jgi:Zn-dependent peptidase ImmA (M78 family)
MTLDDVKDKARNVLKDNFLSEPPINVYLLAKNYGLKIKEGLFPNGYSNISGFITISNGIPILYVNSDDSQNRKNFTVAHELGHWILHKDRVESDPNLAILFRIPLGTLNKDPLEKEANAFAAELLVPKEMLDKLKDNKSAKDLAAIFEVSEEVIGYRLEHTRGGSSNAGSRRQR